LSKKAYSGSGFDSDSDWTRIRIGSGFSNSLDPDVDSAKYLDTNPASVNPDPVSYLAGMSPYISLKIKKRHYEHHMIEAHK
jgi:hypothetical protein